jgi:cell wall-associated NlpC family hydrolase
MTGSTSTKTRLRKRLVGAVLVAASLGVVMAPSAALAQTSKKQQAAELQDQIEASDVELSALAEKLHVAEARRDEAHQTVLAAEEQIERAKVEVSRIMVLVRDNLASLYRRNIAGGSLAEIDFRDTADLLKRNEYAEAQNSRDDALLEELDAAQDDLSAEKAEASQARNAAQAETDTINTAKTALETARAEQQALLDKVTGELAAEVEAERARREQAAKAQYSAEPVNYPDVGPPNGSASQAIAFAKGVIGAGYSTNPRMGPTYDCSGLVSSAWGAAGVSIGGSSGSMYASLPHIPMDAIQPGDLLFWGSGGGSHVALYIGGGQVIDASSSQNAVTQRAIWGSPVGAARVV